MISTWPPPYIVKKHCRAKQVRLRASSRYGLEITVPSRFNLREIPVILEDNKAWIEKHLSRLEHHQCDILPERIELPVCNEIWTIQYLHLNKTTEIFARQHLKEIVVLGDVQDKITCQIKLSEWIREQANVHLPLLLKKVSSFMQLNYKKVTIRDQKTLWGSCTLDKAINLNYKLIFLPFRLVQHILIHELSHTVHHNHSIQFWNLVAKYDGLWKDHRRELRTADKFIPRWIR